ncbi:MAG: MATE family efflux transporter [Lachnospiraceae bacterium]|nr:MATE family efflux transporter [Lachnospiraceae bacterium]
MILRYKNARPGFYQSIFHLMLPIIIQNLISSAVNTVDVMMLGIVGQSALSASSLAGQVAFILNIVYFGMNSALVILASQYWGKGSRETISKIFGLGLLISVTISTTFSVLALVCPHHLMQIWTNDPELITIGAGYLRDVALSYFFMGISQIYLAIMKSCERVKLSMAVSGSTLLLNVCMNAILIFGLFGAPQMGVLGAALATSIARGIELIVCFVDAAHQKLIPLSLRIVFTIPGGLVQDFIKYSLPAFVGDAAWGLATSMFSVIMGRLGSDIVAANSVVTVIRNLVTVVGFSIATGSAILLGKELGENQLETAKRDAASVVHLSIVVSIITGLILALITPIVPNLVNISDTAKDYLRIMQIISIFYQMGQIINTVLIASLFRAGGQSRAAMILDLCAMWLYAVPLGLIAAFVIHLPPIIVYALLCTDEFIKLLPAFLFYKSGKWLNNLTRDFDKNNQSK